MTLLKPTYLAHYLVDRARLRTPFLLVRPPTSVSLLSTTDVPGPSVSPHQEGSVLQLDTAQETTAGQTLQVSGLALVLFPLICFNNVNSPVFSPKFRNFVK